MPTKGLRWYLKQLEGVVRAAAQRRHKRTRRAARIARRAMRRAA